MMDTFSVVGDDAMKTLPKYQCTERGSLLSNPVPRAIPRTVG
jgi:hypothetical protein